MLAENSPAWRKVSEEKKGKRRTEREGEREG